MQLVISAIMPIFALLLLGNLARRTQFLNADFWSQAEKGTYYVLFPCLLIVRLSSTEIDLETAGDVLGFAVLIPLLATGLSFACVPLLRLPAADFTSFFQASTRFNTYLGFALVAVVLPEQAMTLAAIVVAVMIPLLNMLCIAVFAHYTQGSLHPWRFLLSLLKNPLIVACLLGITLNLSGFALPSILQALMQALGQMALPLGLLAVGAGLRLQALRQAGPPLFWASAVKLLVLPLLIFALSLYWQLDELSRAIVVMFAALPTASSAYILARQLGGNAEMMAVLITGETLLAMLSLPLILSLVV